MAQSTSTIQSDEIGNITNIDGIEFFWDGRQLQGAGENGTPYIRYEYNIDGQRTKKILQYPGLDAPVTTEYFYNSGMLMGQKTGSDVLQFMYDESGDIFGFTYNGDAYYYLKNAQNDVWAVTNADGQAVVLYFYDAWGNVTRSYEADGYEAIAEVNPILYRSYYFDAELGFYYLNTRYYVPAIHRFLNADGLAQTGQSILDKNMFTYCLNNPVRYFDPTGNKVEDIPYIVTIPAEGSGTAVITSYTDDFSFTMDYSNGTYTVNVYKVTEQDGSYPVRVVFEEGFEEYLKQSLTIDNSTIYSLLQGSSCLYANAAVTPIDLILLAVELYWDYEDYGYDTTKFLKSAALTLSSASLAMVGGSLVTLAAGAIASFSPELAVGVELVGPIAVGVGLAYAEDYVRRRWIGRDYIYEF